MAKYLEITENPRRLYAIGDIHGCPDELEFLLEYLRNTCNIDDKDQVIFIGDYIDRGFGSKSVLDCLLRFQKLQPRTIFLRGNHEDMLLDYLGLEGTNGGAFLQNGGVETFKSYGIDPFLSPEEILIQFPKDHLSFIANLERMIIAGEYVITHAGLDPLRDLRLQLDHDLFWIRDEFILNIHHFGKTVVFGHTCFQDLFFHLPFKLGIDTALVYGNKLSCVELISGEVFQVDHGSRRIKASTLTKKAKAKVSDRFFRGS